MSEKVVQVFISYSWDSEEHKNRVLALSQNLRKDGIDCQIDRYHPSPPEGWYRWMMDQIEESDYVLVVCTEKYNLRYRNKEERGQGRGVTWEGGLIISELYGGQGINNKFIPILLSPEGEEYIPRSLQAFTVYRLFSIEEHSINQPGDYQNLYRHLTKQPAYVPAKLGQPQKLLPISEASSTVGNHGEILQAEGSIVVEDRAEWERSQPDKQQQVVEQESLLKAKQLRYQQVVQAEILEQSEPEQQQLSNDLIDYTRLEELLKAKKWKEADEQTKKIILTSKQNNPLTAPEIRQLPLELLDNLDRIWMEHSDGKFGLRIQQQRWQKILKPEKKPRFNPFAKKVEPLTESQAWNQFRSLVGWYNNDEKRYVQEPKFDFSMNAPLGCFPRTRLWLHGGYGNTVKQFVALMERVAQLR